MEPQLYVGDMFLEQLFSSWSLTSLFSTNMAIYQRRTIRVYREHRWALCFPARDYLPDRPLRMSRSTAHGAQVIWPLDYMGRYVPRTITFPIMHCHCHHRRL